MLNFIPVSKMLRRLIVRLNSVWLSPVHQKQIAEVLMGIEEVGPHSLLPEYLMIVP